MIPRYLCLPVLLTAVFCMGAPARAQQGSPPQHAQNQRALGTPDSASRSVQAGGTPSVQEVEVRRVRISKTDSCQVIMELGGRVQYQAARLSDPDRIYFDIEHARLSNELLRQPVDVPSGRCLKAVRVAQKSADVVRVVLDVAQVKDYSVSELAVPDRLVVDVHASADNTAANAAPETSAKTTTALAPGSSAPEVRGQASAPRTAPSETAPGPATGQASAPRTAPSETAPGPATGQASAPRTAPPSTSPTTTTGRAAPPTAAPPTAAPSPTALRAAPPPAPAPPPPSVKAPPSPSPMPTSLGVATATAVGQSPSPKTTAGRQGPPPASKLTVASSPQDIGVVRGNVHDPDGTAVPDTNVDLTNSSGGQRLSTTTDEDGVFEFAKVPPGNYVLHVIVPGFDPVEKPVVVGSEPLARLRVKLKIAQVSEKVTVSGQAVVVAEDNRSQAQFNEHLVANLPARDADPLVVPSLFVNPAVVGASGPTLIVDGVETSSLDLPTSSVKSVTVDQNPYSPEFGRPGKGRLEVTTRKGVHRRYRGNLLALFRNSALDARNAMALDRPLPQREIGEVELDRPLNGVFPHAGQTTFFLSGRYHVFNNSAVVHAFTPPGLVENHVITPAGTFIQNVRVPERRTNLFGRIDSHFKPAHGLSLLYKFKNNGLQDQDVGGLELPDRATNVFAHENEVKILETATPSTSFQNQVRLSYRNERQTTSGASAGYAVDILGSADFGSASTNRNIIETLGDMQDVASLFYGRHNLRFGTGVKVRYFSSEDRSNFGGTFIFSSLADFESTPPHPSHFKRNVGNPSVDFPDHEVFSFLQDDMRLRA